MNEAKQAHPSPDALKAFAQGRLEGAELANIESHVVDCDSCCEWLRDVPDGSLLAHVRQTASSPDETGLFGETNGFPTIGASDRECPQELVNHSRYRIIKKLGFGGMGVVYQAEHRLMERPVALKVINQSLVSSLKAIERFRLEVKAAAKLSHRNIVTAHDAEQAGDLHFLVMEFVEGESLAEAVNRRGPLPVIHACNYVVQVAQGLQHALEKGMVHRDIKPQNLMRTPKGTVKILDFGLARLATEADNEESARLTKVGVTLGTTDYIAPEQIEDARNVDIRADLYSLGCTLYFLLTGRVPFPGKSQVEKLKAHLQEEPQPLCGFRNDLPADVLHAVERLMAKDPAARFQTPQEVINALSPFARKGDAKPPEHKPVKPPALPKPQPTEIEATREMEFMIGNVAASEGHKQASEATFQEADPLSLPIEDLAAQSAELGTHRKPRKRGAWPVVWAGALVLLVLAGFAVTSYITNSASSTVAVQQEDPASKSLDESAATNGEANSAEGSSDAVGHQPSAAGSSNRTATALYVLPQRELWWPDFDPPRDALERAGIRVVVASSAMSDIRAGRNVQEVDLLLRDARPADYDMLLFGGAPNPYANMEFIEGEHLQTATAFINEMLRQGKHVATVCNGTAVLAESGCLDGLQAASVGSMRRVQDQHPEVDWVTGQAIVESNDQILTAAGDNRARQAFNERIVELLTD